jgi:hypothetical protein
VAPLEKSLLSMKVLRKSIILGLRKPSESSHAMQLLASAMQQIKILLGISESQFSRQNC